MSEWCRVAKLLPSLSVPRGTEEKFEAYFQLLTKWQVSLNLVSKDSLNDFWTRHILDCAQLSTHVPRGAKSLVDMGSGAGLPGIILAILHPEMEIHLIESDQKKSAFLLEAARICDAKVKLHVARIESDSSFPADVITARALAPLSKLFHYAEPFLQQHTICLFLKGKNYTMELEDGRRTWEFDLTTTPSVSDDTGCILSITNLRKKIL